MSFFETFVENLTPELIEEDSVEILSAKSRKNYELKYENFIKWCNQKNEQNITENVLLDYFLEKSTHVKASTLWSLYSMLKSELVIRNNIDISKFTHLLTYVKSKNRGYIPVTSKTLTAEQVAQFLSEAPDDQFLMVKVALVLGIAGACRIDELVNLSINDVTDLGTSILFTIKKNETKIDRRFIVTHSEENSVDFVNLCKKYMSLRKAETKHSRFFVTYRNNECTVQTVGKNTIGKMPQRIASFLKLPDATLYTGQCFRRTSASSLAKTWKRLDRWKSRNVVDGLAKLRAEKSNVELESKPSTSAASNEFLGENSSDLPIEQVDVGSTSCEETTDPDLDFLPESDEPSLPKQKRQKFVAPKDMKTYCRLCLNPANKTQMVCLGDFHDINYPSRTVQFKKNKILQTEMYLRMIRTLMPNFSHDLVYNPIMCNGCSTRLQMASDFVEQCMATQNLIQQYKDTYCPAEKLVSCEDVVHNKSHLLPANNPDVPSNPKKRKIAKPVPQQSTETVSYNEDFQTLENVNVKTEQFEEMENEEKYEITPEEVCTIKHEFVEEETMINTNETEITLPVDTVIKNEPCSTEISDYNIVATEPTSIKQFSNIDIPTTQVDSSYNKNYLVGVPHKPAQFCPPTLSAQCGPPIEPVASETFVSLVNPVTTQSAASNNIDLSLNFQNNRNS